MNDTISGLYIYILELRGNWLYKRWLCERSYSVSLIKSTILYIECDYATAHYIRNNFVRNAVVIIIIFHKVNSKQIIDIS